MSNHVLEFVYRCLVDSILSVYLVTLHENLSVENSFRPARVVNTDSKIVGSKQRQLCDLFHLSVRRKSLSVLLDKTHPLNCFQHLPSIQRLKVPIVRENVYKRAFTSTTVSILNAAFNLGLEMICVSVLMQKSNLGLEI